ncbi:type II restriction enzyme [Mycoplasma capricolum]|uniref:type II restriction enzyme n=1 Tax=Mycoplasma capricolum TaxID=2095 RepID=UPI003DA2551B
MDLSIDKAWKKLFEKYDILEQIRKDGYFIITAKQIREYKEARLIAKFDSHDELPEIFKINDISILPINNGEYILSHFDLYKELPVTKHTKTNVIKVNNKYTTISVTDISSESKVLNTILLFGILDDFLEDHNFVSTFNGKMRTNPFSFSINTKKLEPKKVYINVKKVQCEIDAGLENDNFVVIIEAKNTEPKDFNIRQLYYPYRYWLTRTNKPIRLVFCTYKKNNITLYEYKFKEPEYFSSIELIKFKKYNLKQE